MSTKPKFTPEETEWRRKQLHKCFQACDLNGDGMIDRKELEAVAKAFNPQADVNQEVKIILAKLDLNQDSHIDPDEWGNVLFDLFRFMKREAFEKHIVELLQLLNNGGNPPPASTAVTTSSGASPTAGGSGVTRTSSSPHSATTATAAGAATIPAETKAAR